MKLPRPEYWHEQGIDVRLNPRVAFDSAGLADFVRVEMGISSAIVLATSGTTGSGPKFVVLKKSAMRASAHSVNTHLGITGDDRWLAPLTLFHVGGLGIFARAALLKNEVVTVTDPLRWDKTGAEFKQLIRDHDISLTALTPTHLSDLVAHSLEAPPSLRGILIGGGAMNESLTKRAIELGWPIWSTYGMTETCSQIATGLDEQSALSGWAIILPGWEVRTEGDVCLVRGEALFSGYVTRDAESGQWIVDKPIDDGGWFRTGDRIQLRHDKSELSFLGRTDDLVKSLGELVSIRKLENRIQDCGMVGVVFAIPDERRGHRFVAVLENGSQADIEIVNETLAPFERIGEVIVVGELPRTAVGKIAKGELRQQVVSRIS